MIHFILSSKLSFQQSLSFRLFLLITYYYSGRHSNLLNSSCTDPVQGPTEINRFSQEDMGLSDQDILDITKGWLETMTQTQAALEAHDGYTWSLIPGQQNANASPFMITASTCAKTIRPACSLEGNPHDAAPLLFGLSMGNSTQPLPFLEVELASFLVMRGKYAYVGAGFWGMVSGFYACTCCGPLLRRSMEPTDLASRCRLG